MIRIETNVPIPQANGGRYRACKYPWRELRPGDSFYVAKGNRNSINAGVRNWSAKLGAKFTVRTMDGGVRVWRVS